MSRRFTKAKIEEIPGMGGEGGVGELCVDDVVVEGGDKGGEGSGLRDGFCILVLLGPP